MCSRNYFFCAWTINVCSNPLCTFYYAYVLLCDAHAPHVYTVNRKNGGSTFDIITQSYDDKCAATFFRILTVHYECEL